MIHRPKSIPARLAACAAPLLLATAVAAQPILPSGTSSGIPAPAANDPVEALGRYLRVLSTFPNNLDALTGAGNAALAIGDANAAISFFARAEEIAPRNGRIKAGLAAALVQVEQPKTALKLFGEAVALGVPEGEVAGDRGLAFDLRGENRRAQQEYAQSLKWRSDDEITRRLAVSQAISGDREAAMATLDALLRRQDRAAWRVRAFVLALTGDRSGAEEAAVAAMPRAQAQALMPYFARLAVLRPGEKAAAVHLGQFPSDGKTKPLDEPIFADAGAPPRPDTPRSDVPLIPSGATLVARTSLADAGPSSSAPRRRPGLTASVNGRPDSTATILAAAAAQRTKPLFRYPPDTPAPAPAVVPAPVAAAAPPPPAVRGAAPPVQAAPPVSLAAAAPAAVLSAPPPARGAIAGPPAPEVRTGFVEPLPPRSLANPSSVDRPAAAYAAPAEPNVALAFALPSPAVTQAPPAVRAVDLPASIVAEAPAPAAKPPAPILPAPPPAPATAAEPVRVAAAPVTIVLPNPPARPAAAPVKEVAVKAAAKAEAPVKDAAKPAAREKLAADAKRGGKDAAAIKLAALDARKDTKARDTADAKAADKSKDAKAKDAKDAKAKGAKAKEAKATDGDKAPGGERYWVQVASGANKSDLGKVWENTKTKAPKLLAGRATWTAPWKASNRLLVGPFKSEDEAQGFVNSLGKAGMGGIQFTSRGGSKVERLATR